MQENRLSSGVSCGMTVDHDRNVEWIMKVQRERERERERKRVGVLHNKAI